MIKNIFCLSFYLTQGYYHAMEQIKNRMTHLKKVKLYALCFWSFFIIQGLSKVYGVDRIVGSSTLFPVLSAVADHFYFQNLGTPPLIEPTGTGGGMTLFCSKSSQSPLFVAASRPILKRERALCEKENIQMIEIDLGLDGIVLVHTHPHKIFNITRHDLKTALEDKKPYPVLWSDIQSNYPPTTIKVLGPSSTAGTHEALMHILAFKTFRKEGYQASDQETLLVQKLMIEQTAYGIVSFGFIQKNKKLVFPCPIEGVIPTLQTIKDGRYALSRRLYLYVNKQKLQQAPNVKAFLDFLMSPEVTGKDGLFVNFGLVSHSREYYKKMQQKWHML